MNDSTGTITEETPLYNIRIVRSYTDYLFNFYPQVDIDEVLDYAGITRFQYNDYGYWCTQGQIDRFYTIISEKTENPFISREVGRYVMSRRGILTQYILQFKQLADVSINVNKIYTKMSRGSRVRGIKLGSNKIQITATPVPGVKEKQFQCENRTGSIEGLIKFYNHEFPLVEHPKCIHRGDPECVYEYSWVVSKALRWRRWRNHAIVISSILSITSLTFFSVADFFYISLWGALISSLFAWNAERTEKKICLRNVDQLSKTAGAFMLEVDSRYGITKFMEQVGKASSVLQDEKEVVSAITNLVKLHLGYDRCLVMLSSNKHTHLEFTDGYGVDKEDESFFEQTEFNLTDPKSRGFLVEVFRSQKPILIDSADEVFTTLSERSKNFIKRLNIKSLVAVPVVYKNESLGILAVDNNKSLKPFSQGDVNLLIAVALQLSGSLFNSRSYRLLNQSELKYRQLVETIEDVVFTLDQNGIITYMSPVVSVSVGWLPGQLEGLYFSTVINEKHHRAADLYFKKLLKGRGSETVELDFLSLDGSLVPFEISISAIKREGVIESFMGVGRDISLRLQEKENKNDIIIRSLAHAKLASLGELWGGLGGDILSLPIGELSNSIELLGEGGKTEESLKSLVGEAQGQLNHIRHVVGHISSFGDKSRDTIQEVDIRDIWENVSYVLSEKLSHNYINLKINLCPNLPLIKSNPIQLEQIFISLFQNALDALDEIGGGQITIETTHLNDEIIIRFSDNGSGVPESLREKIFDPFFTTKIAERGTGVGLAMVSNLVVGLGGYIECDQAKEGGAMFYMKFPVSLDSNIDSRDSEGDKTSEEINLTAKEISKVLGVSYVTINNRANREKWPYRTKTRRGGPTKVYLIHKIRSPYKNKILRKL